MIAESPAMRDVLNFVRRVAASEATTILLEGENGTGKDLVAKTLHYQSLRQAEPFIASNCAAIPDSRALEKTNGNQTQAARLLRVTRDTLRYKMKKFNLR